jgi:hypothetical protein
VHAWACACICVRVVLLIQHATHMRNIVTLLVAPLVPHHFSALSRKRHDFQKKVTDHKMCFDFLYNFYLKHFSLYDEISEMLS